MSRKITTRILLFVTLTSSIKQLQAQQWLGRTTGNYSGTYGLYNNASSIADSKYRYYFNIWGQGDNFYNNYLLYDKAKTAQWGEGNNKPGFMDLDGKSKYYSFNQDLWGPAFMFPISRNVNMSINMRQRHSVQYYGISEPVARMVFNGIDSGSSIYGGNDPLSRNTFYHNGKFATNIQSNQELSVTVAGILAKNENHMLSGGATLKLINGLGATYAKGAGFDVAVTGNNSIQMQNADIEYAYTNSKNVIEPLNNPYGLFSLPNKGFGAGVDLGLTYTYTASRGKYARDKYCNNSGMKSDYDIKLAAAFNDIGGIRYNNAVKYNYSNANISNITVPPNTFKNLDHMTQNTLDTIGKYVFEPMGANKSGKFNTTLPTAFNFQADFRLADHFYTAVYLNQSLKKINTTGMRSTSMLSIIPRVETRLVEFSMPLTLSENYKNFYVGAYVRVGPVFVGSDNLGGLFKVAGNGSFRAADIYGGVSFGLDHCNKWFYDYLVEPTYIDTVKQKDSVEKKDTILQKDTVKTEKRDTIKIIERDTIKIKVHDTVYIKKQTDLPRKVIHDTIYIEKTVRTKVDIERENALRRRENDIIVRQKQLDERERLLNQKEVGPNSNDTGALRRCKNNNLKLNDEIIYLTKQVTDKDHEIDRLKKQIDSLSKINEKNNTTIITLKTEKTKVEKDVNTANRKADSLQNKINEINIALNNCKKNSTEITVLKADKTKAEKDAKDAVKKADSLQSRLNEIVLLLDNCQKNKTGQNTEELNKIKAEKEKAEKDAAAANKKADSLQSKLSATVIDLDDCKKNNANVDVNIVKLKKAEEDKLLYKSELDGANKTIASLNTKIYRKDAIIDSLINELSKCGTKTDDETAGLLKLCNDEKAKMNAEVIELKKRIASLNKSLDSTYLLMTGLKKEESEKDEQIKELNLRLKNNNCDTFKMQLEEKTKSINDIRIQNTTLQNKVNTQTKQLNELNTELLLVKKQNQDCSDRLDSCMRSLLEHKKIDPQDKLPGEDKPPGQDKGKDEGKGPMEGNINNEPGVSFDKTVFDFGNADEGDKVIATFTLTNNGNNPLSITGYETSCGCTTPEYTKAPILPGESANITVGFNTSGKSGSQVKHITLLTTEGSNILTLQGSVKEQKILAGNDDVYYEGGDDSPNVKINKGVIVNDVLSHIFKAVITGSSTNTSVPSGKSPETKTKTNTGTTQPSTDLPGRNSTPTNSTPSSTRRR